ncbi:MAG TPA: M14 metallopeptidase family protein [Kofleriaceae bacterium]|nr:M14 metallopeptidase family protein [Kofleriaceae bacterium]
MPHAALVWVKSRRSVPLLGLGVAVVAAVAVSAGHRWASTTTPPPARVAIRVPCEPAGACDLAASLASDVWSEHRSPAMPLDVVVTADALARLAAAGVTWEVLVPDIDAEARAERARLRAPAAARPADWFADYRDYRATTTYLHQLAELAPGRATVHGIGSSVEGRTIWALRIGGGAPDATPMLINGTQHAREWIATMVSTCVADRLVRGYDHDPAIRDFVDHTELWVVPVVNPDGYQHSWAQDRYWRKNRRGRHGVDLNRNFGVAWGGDGSSSRERSEVYRGEHPFSEPETRALRDLALRERVALHIDFHAYGQLVLYPWGYTASPTRDRDRFAALGDRMASAIFAAHQTRYRLMSAVQLYPASGTMSDWMYGEANALSYTIELRPTGRGGFVLPPSEIRPTCDEGLAAVLALRAAHRGN